MCPTEPEQFSESQSATSVPETRFDAGTSRRRNEGILPDAPDARCPPSAGLRYASKARGRDIRVLLPGPLCHPRACRLRAAKIVAHLLDSIAARLESSLERRARTRRSGRIPGKAQRPP